MFLYIKLNSYFTEALLMYYEDKLVNSVYVIGRCLLLEFYGPCKSIVANSTGCN
jgi:hypothetical protein